MKTQHLHLSLDDAVSLLKESGLRKTIARTHLLQCVAHLDSPRTQSEICELLSAYGFDTSTIFRGLTDLTEAGLVVRIDPGDHVWRFEMRDRDADGKLHSTHHPHAICTKCGNMSCLKSELLIRCEHQINGLKIEELNLQGLCPTCQNNDFNGDPKAYS